MINESLSLRLKKERKRLHLSQEEAATRAGVQRETWSRYENGGMQPGTDVWVALALMGADVRYILSGEPEPLYADTGLSDGEKAVVALYRGIEPGAQKMLMDFLGLIVKTGAEAVDELELLAKQAEPPAPPKRIPRAALIPRQSSVWPDKKFTPPGAKTKPPVANKRKKDSSL